MFVLGDVEMEQQKLIGFLEEVKGKSEDLVNNGDFNFSVSEAIKKLWDSDVSKKFGSVIEDIEKNAKEYDFILKAVGLSDNHLNLKRKIWRDILSKNIIDKIFDFVNSLLSSLEVVISNPALHMIKEFKDMMEISYRYDVKKEYSHE